MTMAYQNSLSLISASMISVRYVSPSIAAFHGLADASSSSFNGRILCSTHKAHFFPQSRPALTSELAVTSARSDAAKTELAERDSNDIYSHSGADEGDWESESEDWSDEANEHDDDVETEFRQSNRTSVAGSAEEVQPVGEPRPRRFPLLGNQEKKELRAYAHQLGKRLKMQQVGKWGVTAPLAAAIGDALEKNEILKLKILENSPKEMWEVEGELERLTECQVVGRIGRTLLLYRPSLTRMKAAKEMRENVERRERRARSRRGVEGTGSGQWGQAREGERKFTRKGR